MSLALSAPGRAADSIEINVVIATSGAFAFNGKESAQSLAVAEQTVNSAGGINGKPVKFVIHDDQTDPRVAVQIANQLLSQNVTVMLGPSPVAACSAVAPLLERRAVMFCTSGAYHPPADSYFYAAGIPTTGNMVFASRFLRRHGFTRIASINSNDALGQDIDRALAAALALPENKGVTLAAAEHFNPTDINIDAPMARVKAAGAQAIITGDSGTLLGLIFHAYTDLGMTLPIVTPAVALNYATVTQFASILPKELLATGQPSDAPDAPMNRAQRAAVRTFVDAFKAAGIPTDHALAVPWDPAMIIVAALRKLGPDATAAEINAFISNLHGWYGAAGEYDFRNGNHTGLDPDSQVMLRWNPERKRWLAVK